MTEPGAAHAADPQIARDVEELQIKLAFLERQVAELDEVIRQVADDNRALRAELRELRELRSTDEGLLPAIGNDPADERPPHY